MITSFIHTYYIHTSLSHISGLKINLYACVQTSVYTVWTCRKDLLEAWLFSIMSIILYAHNFWQILISRSCFWTTAQPSPMEDIYLACCSFPGAEENTLHLHFQGTRFLSWASIKTRSHPTQRVEPQGFYTHIHTAFSYACIGKPDKKQISRRGTKLDLGA